MYKTLHDLKLFLDTVLATQDPIPTATEILQTLSNEDQILQLLGSILKDNKLCEEISKRSNEDFNGFDKFDLIVGNNQLYHLRFHIWWEDKVTAMKEPIHNHSWDLSSVVLCGEVRYQEFVKSKLGDELFHYEYYRRPGKDPTLTLVGKDKLYCNTEGVMATGSRYVYRSKLLHRVEKGSHDLAATLIIHGPYINIKSDTYSYDPLALEGNKMPFQAFTKDELRAKLTKFIGLYKDSTRLVRREKATSNKID